jgi:hypothetical protein
MQVPSTLEGEPLNQNLQTDASQYIAAIARWENEGGACDVLSKKTDAELKKRPRYNRNGQEPGPSRARSTTADACVLKEERAMTDTTYVQQLRRTISGEFYFGAMCRETRRRIAISTDASSGKQRYSQSGQTIVSCNHCHKTHRFDNYDIFTFRQVGWE